ncbi:MAG: hypothetical protein MMC33_005650 [Icmadophila ericetorum]|nr:hypothetical protein [Icmadophila ericetorum]
MPGPGDRERDSLAVFEGLQRGSQIYGSFLQSPFPRADVLLPSTGASAEIHTPQSSSISLEDLDQIFEEHERNGEHVLSGSGKDGSVAPNQKTSVFEMLGDGSGQQPVAKRALMEAYLYHPDHPWPSDDLIVIPIHPGQSSYRLDTGEPTKTPSKRELTDQEKRQTQWLRKNGGPCEKCLKSKKKCVHKQKEMERSTMAEEKEKKRLSEDTILSIRIRKVPATWQMRRRPLCLDTSPIQRRRQRRPRRSSTPLAPMIRGPSSSLTTARENAIDSATSSYGHSSLRVSSPALDDIELRGHDSIISQNNKASHRTTTGYRGANFEEEYGNAHSQQIGSVESNSITTSDPRDQTTQSLHGEGEDVLDNYAIFDNVNHFQQDGLAYRNLSHLAIDQPRTDQSPLQSNRPLQDEVEHSIETSGSLSNEGSQLPDISFLFCSNSQQESFIHDPEFESQTVDYSIVDWTQMATPVDPELHDDSGVFSESLIQSPDRLVVRDGHLGSPSGSSLGLGYSTGEYSSSPGYAVNTPSSNAQSNLDDVSLLGIPFESALDLDSLSGTGTSFRKSPEL